MRNDETYYKKEEQKAVEQATSNGVLFETAAKISENIKREGLKDFEYLQMLKGKLDKEVRKK